MNIVLITDGLSPLVPRFHTLPNNPVGIIDYSATDKRSFVGLKALAFRAYRFLRGQKPYLSLEDYCKKRRLRYARVVKSNASDIKHILLDWQAGLAVTSCCPTIPLAVLEDLSFGAINLHPSLLPRYRGADPMFWQVHDQEPTVGVIVHYLDSRVDAGPIVSQIATPRPLRKSKVYLDKTIEGDLGRLCVIDALEKIRQRIAVVQPQPRVSTTRYARYVTADAVPSVVDMSAISLDALVDIICYFESWPASVTGGAGWKRRVLWTPVRITRYPTPRADVSNGQVRHTWIGVVVLHQDGEIVLRPRVSLRMLLNPVS